MLHQGNAVGDSLGDDDPLRPRQEHIFVVENVVPDARRNVAVVTVVADGQLLVLRFLPFVIGRPRCAAPDHEHDLASAPVRKYDPAIEERNESILSGGAERRRRGQLARGEGAGSVQQRPDHALLAVVGETDLQPGRRFLADSVFLPKPREDVGVPHEPLMIKVRNGGERLPDPQGEAMVFLDCRQFLRAATELR